MTAQEQPGILKRRLVRFSQAPTPFLSVQSRTQTLRSAGKVAEVFGDLTPRRPEDFQLNGVLRRVRLAWRDRALARLSQRDARLAPYVFFYPDTVPDSWLGLDHTFLHAYDVQAAGSNSPRATIALLYEFLKTCRTDFSTYERIRSLLNRRFFADHPSVRLNRWRDRCRTYKLLEDDNHAALLKCWRDAGSPPPEDFLREAGLAPVFDRSELVRRAAREVLLQTKARLLRQSIAAEELESAMSWLVAARRLRFETLRIEIADALLGPFVSTRPSPGISEALRRFFLDYFGDPRTAGVRGWLRVPDAQRHVILRILVGQTLDDFFRLLDRTADKQWRYRKAFWSAYETRGVVLDAWVALGKNARDFAGPELRKASGRLGAFRGYGIQGNQSVLLIKIEDITIAEWSHNGKCRFWLASNPNAPALYLQQYMADRLRADGRPDAEIVHGGSESGAWQEKIAAWIASHTNVRLYRSQYMP